MGPLPKPQVNATVSDIIPVGVTPMRPAGTGTYDKNQKELKNG